MPGDVDGLLSRGSWKEELPAGNSHVLLTIGDRSILLESLPTSWEPFVAERLVPFAKSARLDARADLHIRCREAAGLVLPLPQPGQPTAIEVTASGERIVVRSHWQDGWFSPARGEGELVFHDRAWDRFGASLENYLRVLTQERALTEPRFLLHAAAVIDDERAIVLLGPSGAGKSTAVAHAAPRPAISDDIVLVELADDEPCVVAAPFHLVRDPSERPVGRFPIAAVLRLRPAEEDRLEALSPARAGAALLAALPFAEDLALPAERRLELAAQLAARVPVFEHPFTLAGRTFELLARELG